MIILSIFATLGTVLHLPALVLAIPNPAAVYCDQLGFKTEIKTDPGGSQHSVCIFPDGSQCDQWQYFYKCSDIDSYGTADKIDCDYPCQPQVCKQAGEPALVADCCQNLEKIVPARVYDNNCQEITMTGWTHICSDCGNTICEDWESGCNCPADCQERTSQEKNKDISQPRLSVNTVLYSSVGVVVMFLAFVLFSRRKRS